MEGGSGHGLISGIVLAFVCPVHNNRPVRRESETGTSARTLPTRLARSMVRYRGRHRLLKCIFTLSDNRLVIHCSWRRAYRGVLMSSTDLPAESFHNIWC
jgi:hypothetical protein